MKRISILLLAATTFAVPACSNDATQGGGDDSSGSGSDNSGPGSTNSGPGDAQQQDEGTTCGTSDLTPGTTVHEAELEGQTFEKVELIK